VVNVTSDKCYENKEWLHAYREEDPMGGYDPYSASKGCAELVTAAYRSSFFSEADSLVKVASARAGNVIGGGDWAPDRIVPDIVRSVKSGEPVSVRNRQATRPWQHVLEPLCGYLCLAEAIHKNSAESSDFNFGPEIEDVATVREVVEIARAVYGRGDVHWGVRRDSLHEAKALVLDNSKAKAQLGVRPAWSLQEAVSRTMSWYRRQADGENARSLCEQDIEAFLEAK
jgi:CDP-glucose 4,6-dehydratase